ARQSALGDRRCFALAAPLSAGAWPGAWRLRKHACHCGGRSTVRPRTTPCRPAAIYVDRDQRGAAPPAPPPLSLTALIGYKATDSSKRPLRWL
ncbi:hypothetical protein KGM_213628B, partial [Danaus plexippus plexippus]